MIRGRAAHFGQAFGIGEIVFKRFYPPPQPNQFGFLFGDGDESTFDVSSSLDNPLLGQLQFGSGGIELGLGLNTGNLKAEIIDLRQRRTRKHHLTFLHEELDDAPGYFTHHIGGAALGHGTEPAVFIAKLPGTHPAHRRQRGIYRLGQLR